MTTLSLVRKSLPSRLSAKVEAALTAAIREPAVDPAVGFYAVKGMSGKRYRLFINTLMRVVENPRYLEIGSWLGSTLCAAIAGNVLTAVAIDNWSEYGGPKAKFVDNVRPFVCPQTKVLFLESDFRKVNYNDMGEGFNVYLFDGPHAEQDHYDALALVLPCLDDEFVFIVDDWNWAVVRAGTFAAIEKCGLRDLYSAEIRTSLDDTQPQLIGKHSDWHNGYFIAVLAKPKRGRKGTAAAPKKRIAATRSKRPTVDKPASRSR